MTGNWIHGKYCSLLNIVPGRPPGQPQATRKRWPYSIRPVASGLLSRIVYSRGTPCGYPGGGGYPGGWWVPSLYNTSTQTLPLFELSTAFATKLTPRRPSLTVG